MTQYLDKGRSYLINLPEAEYLLIFTSNNQNWIGLRGSLSLPKTDFQSVEFACK